jgi:hypothetical protein
VAVGTRNLARWIAIGAGLFMVVAGLWAFFSPREFFNSVATWPPFNKHFIHDIGAFQIGIGLTLLLAAFRTDALFVALGGAAVGQTFHFFAHLQDKDLGGKDSDVIVFGVVAAVLIFAVYTRGKTRLRSR